MQKRRQEHGFIFEKMLEKELILRKSADLKFDYYLDNTPVQVKTTTGNSLRLGRYRNGLEIGQDFYIMYAMHKNHEVSEVKAFLIDGLEYSKQFLFAIQHYFDEYIKPLPDRSGKYKDYCADIKYLAKDKIVLPEVKKGGGGNNRLQSYIQIKDLSKIGTEVDLGLDKFEKKTFASP